VRHHSSFVTPPSVALFESEEGGGGGGGTKKTKNIGCSKVVPLTFGSISVLKLQYRMVHNVKFCMKKEGKERKGMVNVSREGDMKSAAIHALLK
jgi:hypothetical protein